MKNIDEKFLDLKYLLEELKNNLLEVNYPQLLAKELASNGTHPSSEILLSIDRVISKP